MHPKEFKKQRTGTGRLAHLSLPGSEILMGINFTKNPRLIQLLNDPQYFPMLMYPGDDAICAGDSKMTANLENKTLLVLIIDSTWACSKKMIKSSPNIMALPKLSFGGSYKSIFTFKREPAEYCISTIESCYYLIKEMQAANLCDGNVNPEPLMNVFKRMIVHQLEKENQRIESGVSSYAHDWKYTKKKEIPNFTFTDE